MTAQEVSDVVAFLMAQKPSSASVPKGRKDRKQSRERRTSRR